MPEVFYFENARWALGIWTRDSVAPKVALRKTLAMRGGKPLPEEKVRLSFDLSGGEQCSFGGQGLAVGQGRRELDIPEPLCYENRDYEFEFTFRNGCCPDEDKPVCHRLKEVETRFRVVGASVRGVINFGNNIGWFRLGVRGHRAGVVFNDTVSFQVFPTKMDMSRDLDLISGVIDSVYPLWRFSVAQKTDAALSRAHRREETFELLWIAQFKSLAGALANAVQLICRSPHSRLLPYARTVKADRIAGKIAGKLEERVTERLVIKQYDKRYRIEKRKLSYDTPENRFVKMALSYAVKRVKLFSAQAKALRSTPEGPGLSETFFEELKQLLSPFEKLSAEPLFREIGAYDGRIGESLVLHERAGYARAYRIWLQLKLYLDCFGDDAAVSVRSVEQLYEVWCLLEIRRLLIDELGFTETADRRLRLQNSRLEKILRETDEKFLLSRTDGATALLIHEPTYRGRRKPEFDRIYSWTTAQRPDIFLEVALPSGEKVRWLFDAKYRIDGDDNKEWPQKGIDTVPDDAINQMHRYRDALIYISRATEDGGEDKSRPVIGAFALYPGWFEQSAGENPYVNSIEAVGIGAFPLMPGMSNVWLKDFLKSRLGTGKPASFRAEADELFLHEAVRIAPFGMKQFRHSDLVLAADISRPNRERYVNPFRESRAEWYHIPESTLQNYRISRYIMRELRYCAFTTFEGGGRVCRYIYPIRSIELKPRNEIDQQAGEPNPEKGTSPYWVC